ncbi:MAG TPA: MerR family transcriptional regulator, partial [Actinomycetota bacterium]
MSLTVSALAAQVGLSADTVRYYERVGLLPRPTRSPAGYRLYDEAAVDRLRLIRGAQRAGLRLKDIGHLLQAVDQGHCPCGHTQDLLRQRLNEVRAEVEAAEICCDLTAGDGSVWAVDPHGAVVRIDPQRGRVAQRIQVRIDSTVHTNAVFAGRFLWVSSDSTPLLRVDPQTGRTTEIDLGD